MPAAPPYERSIQPGHVWVGAAPVTAFRGQGALCGVKGFRVAARIWFVLPPKATSMAAGAPWAPSPMLVDQRTWPVSASIAFTVPSCAATKDTRDEPPMSVVGT